MKQTIAFAVTLCLLLAVAECKKRNPAEYWNPIGKTKGNERITFLVALNQQNIDLLEKIALEVSDPSSPKYGQHLSKEEILDLVSPPLEVSEYVADYFKDQCAAGKVEVQNLRDALSVTAPVACVEDIFNVRMLAYQHINIESWTVIRAAKWGTPLAIPTAIADKVQMITGIVDFPRGRNSKIESSTEVPPPTYNYIIPQTIRKIYSIPTGSKITNPKSSQAVIEFTPEDGPYFSDMISFAQNANEYFGNFSHFVGPYVQTGADESTLDAQYQISLAPYSPNQFYVTVVNGWIYEMAVLLFNLPQTPLVNSISYGWTESLSCESYVTYANCTGINSQVYNSRADAELAKLAANGVSVIVSSGDAGAPGDQNYDCSLDGTNQPLWPQYPAASPWVTTVSATVVVDSMEQNTAVPLPPICNMSYPCSNAGPGCIEQPCMINNTYYQWTTGGGFSNYTARPSWQNAAVSQYLTNKNALPPSQYFHSGNRGYPDVSAVGSRFLFWDQGNVGVVAGTSASTPTFSAIAALLNDYRLNNGKKPLGFLNPLLYQMAAKQSNTFKDITNGDNASGEEDSKCMYGYDATVGWDAVTGLGTPNYANMLAYVKNLP